MKKGTSKCMLCGKQCEEEFIGKEIDGEMVEYAWTHSNGDGGHPPYPKMEGYKNSPT